jgi:DNA gyrase/topoisomerase IV subunit B
MSWSGNMKEHSKPEITDYEGEDYTIVRFHPDLKLFHMKNLSTDMVSLFKKRVVYCNYVGL